MKDFGNMAEIQPVKLGPKSRFNFLCKKNLKCFTKCCRGIRIVLTPYDIIRLKNRLELSSTQFLAIYTEPKLLEKTDLPVVTLKMTDDNEKSCPFVRDKEGCIIYSDRPAACRYYPLGTGSLIEKEGADDDGGFYFFVKEPHCLGFDKFKDWTVSEWRADQGVDWYDKINKVWTDIIVRKRSFPPNIKLTEEAKKMFFMASFDVDRFKSFIFESSFLKRNPVDDKTLEKIKEDETELFIFGIDWLKRVLFKNQDTYSSAKG